MTQCVLSTVGSEICFITREQGHTTLSCTSFTIARSDMVQIRIVLEMKIGYTSKKGELWLVHFVSNI